MSNEQSSFQVATLFRKQSLEPRINFLIENGDYQILLIKLNFVVFFFLILYVLPLANESTTK